jgi:hypothetical protein
MLSALTQAAETAEHGGSSMSPYLVGAIALGILLFLLLVLITFGGGREHS